MKVTTVKCGFSGMAGNKGAAVVRFELFEESFCFVCTHLAAGQKDVKARNENYKTIMDSLSFTSGDQHEGIMDHTRIWWIGDLNYRINLPNDDVRSLVKKKKWDTLYNDDQLKNARRDGAAFSKRDGWQEGALAFEPTYKYDTGTTIYDTSKKKRSPAWCDRVLWIESDAIEQLNYVRSELMQSDHRPVASDFVVMVRVVGEVLVIPITRM